jgi:hypothetical protein
MANDSNDIFNHLKNKGVSKIDPITIPGFTPYKAVDGVDYNKYKMRYLKIDFDDPGSVAELELLETRGIHTDDDSTFIMERNKFFDKDRAFMLVVYLEKDRASS